ncbi:MAG: T9SS type A sorting domain-containing protein, partial [Saprospiraceae bacterium]|nr:T9SS type A sorting domain-containing protein [Saprospiraceae bacterium]
VDCGGPDCPACPTCDDGILNGNETGVDCGGPDCAPCSGECTTQLINSNDFNSSYGIWNDGGSDCTRSSAYADYAVGGTGAVVRLRDNSSSSNMTTDDLNLIAYQELTVDFTYVASSMDNPNEDFFLEISTDGGASFAQVEEWNLDDEFVNEVRYFETVTIPGPFSANTQIRFRCDASSNTDYVYIDDVSISGCVQGVGSRLSKEVPAVLSTKEIIRTVGLYPNPTRGQITLSFVMQEAAQVQLRITDISGKLIRQEAMQIDEGTQQRELNADHLSAGVYFMHIQSKDQIITKRFVVIQ